MAVVIAEKVQKALVVGPRHVEELDQDLVAAVRPFQTLSDDPPQLVNRADKSAAGCVGLMQDQLREYVDEKMKSGEGDKKIHETTRHRRLDMTPVLLYMIAGALLGEDHVQATMQSAKCIPLTALDGGTAASALHRFALLQERHPLK